MYAHCMLALYMEALTALARAGHSSSDCSVNGTGCLWVKLLIKSKRHCLVRWLHGEYKANGSRRDDETKAALPTPTR